jgi:hypothetical protein
MVGWSQQPPTPVGQLPTLAEGRFGKCLDARVSPVLIDGEPGHRTPPLTVECWVKLFSARHANMIASCDPRESSQHWELRSSSGAGHFEAYLPGYSPEIITSERPITDSQWHVLAMSFDGATVKLYVDGVLATDQKVTRHDRLRPKPGHLCIGLAIEGKSHITCQGLIDDVRISRVVRDIKPTTTPAILDPLTVGLWPFDQLDQLAGDPAWTPRPTTGVFPDWEKAQEKDWVDGRFQEMNTGPSLNATFQYPSWTGKDFVYKGTALRLGENSEAAVIFDRAQLRYACGWTGGYLHHSNARYGLLNTPKPVGTIAFATSPKPGWADSEKGQFDPVPPRTMALPTKWGRFRGLSFHDHRPLVDYDINGVLIQEAPWFVRVQDMGCFTRDLNVVHNNKTLRMSIAEVPGADFREKRVGEVTLYVAEREGQVTAVRIAHQDPARIAPERGRLTLELPPCNQCRSVSLWLWSGPQSDFDRASRALAAAESPTPSVEELIRKPAARRWGDPLVTRGEVAKDDKPYVIDTLTIPYENRFKALFFCTGVDFLPSGDVVMCTVHGDVWLIKGVDKDLKELRWHRFATGLYHPLGLKVVNGIVHVLERGQITKLHDLNDDGEADHYECLTNAWHTGRGEHSYDTNLETDSEGRFYFFKTGDADLPHGGALLRCNADGSNVEVYCTGFRHPMALSVSPTGQVTGSDQEGNWMPSTRIDFYQKDGFYGYMPAHHRKTPPSIYDSPVCWFPRTLCNSAGGHSWVPADKFGPLAGQLLHLSYGRCRIQYVLPVQQVDGVTQTGAVDLGLKFLSGIMRGRFHPKDGHFYVAGLNGWQTAAVRDGCLQRVRYTGKPVLLPLTLAAHANGLVVKFSQPLDPTTVEPRRLGFSQWNYRYSGDYGSKAWSITNPNREGADTIPIKTATLLADGQTVFLEIPHLRPAMQCQLTYDLRTKTGEPLTGDLYHTIYKMAEPRK